MLMELIKKHPDSPPVLVHPPVLFSFGFLVGLLLNYWLNASFGIGNAIELGYLFLFGGFGIAAWAVWHLRSAQTNVPTNLPTTALVTTGPFRTTRNPIYIGLALSFLGLASLMDAPIAMLMLVPVLIVLHVGVVLREETYLEQKFGEDYTDYAARTKRYF